MSVFLQHGSMVAQVPARRIHGVFPERRVAVLLRGIRSSCRDVPGGALEPAGPRGLHGDGVSPALPIHPVRGTHGSKRLGCMAAAKPRGLIDWPGSINV